jgi:hypothetical protein
MAHLIDELGNETKEQNAEGRFEAYNRMHYVQTLVKI